MAELRQGLSSPEARGQQVERVRKIFDKAAPKYDREIARMERLLFGGGREWVCRQAGGDVLEIAFGTGRNLSFYSKEVRVTGVELSPRMLDIGREHARELGRSADLRVGDVHSLEFADESFDAVVCTLSLCTVPDPRSAVAEAWRVLRPMGRLLLLEHVRSPAPVVRLVQRLLDPLAVCLGGDHLLHDPLDYLEELGFELERVERLKWGIVERVSALKRGGSASHPRL